MKKKSEVIGKRNEIREEWMKRRCEEEEGEVNECTGD